MPNAANQRPALMPTSPRDPRPDAISREVDRLLARLSHSGPQAAHSPRSPSAGPVTPRSVPRVSSAAPAPSRNHRIALWARVLLGLGFGAVMTQWPYPKACGATLLAYLGAVGMVLVAGGWIALASWKLRAGLAHLLALVLFFWGMILAAGEVLPRVGYAAVRADWRCRAGLSPGS
jgi:hypothetical protein